MLWFGNKFRYDNKKIKFSKMNIEGKVKILLAQKTILKAYLGLISYTTLMDLFLNCSVRYNMAHKSIVSCQNITFTLESGKLTEKEATTQFTVNLLAVISEHFSNLFQNTLIYNIVKEGIRVVSSNNRAFSETV